MQYLRDAIRGDAPRPLPIERGQVGVGPAVVIEPGPGPRPGPGQAMQAREFHTRHGNPDPNQDQTHDRSWFRNFKFNYTMVTMVGLGCVATCSVGFASWGLYRAYQARHSLLRAAEDTLTGWARPNDIVLRNQLARPIEAVRQNRQLGDYRPPPPPRFPAPPPAYGLIERNPRAAVREQRRRGVNDELNARDRPALLARHAQQHVEQEAGEGVDGASEGTGSVDDLHPRNEDMQSLHRLCEARFRAVDARFDILEGQNRQILEILQCRNRDDRPVGRVDRRPHDNFGRPPRDDDDDGDDDIPPPYPQGPGGGIRVRPPAPPANNAGTAIPSANHLDLTGPALAAIRPIVNVEPEAVRDLEHRAPATVAPAPPPAAPPSPPVEAANPDPNRIYNLAELGGAIRAIQDQYREYSAGETRRDVNFDQSCGVMRGIGEVHPEYTANQAVNAVVDDIRHIRRDRALRFTWRRDSNETAGEASPEVSNGQTEIRDSAGSADSAEPLSPTSSESSWTTIGAPASEAGTDFLGDENARMYEGLLNEPRESGQRRSAPDISTRPVTSPSTTSEFSDFSEIDNPVPSEPGPSNWACAIPADSLAEEDEAEARRFLARQLPVDGKGEPIVEQEEQDQGPVFRLVDQLVEPIGPSGQVVRIRLRSPRRPKSEMDDQARLESQAELLMDAEVRGQNEEITHVTIDGKTFSVTRRGNRYVIRQD